MSIIGNKCSKCNIIKNLEDFSFLSNGKKHCQCKQCRNNKMKNLNYPRNQIGTKECYICKEEKNVFEFNSCKSKLDGLSSSCKSCSKNSSNKWLSISNSNFIKKIYLSCKHNAKVRSKSIKFKITEQDVNDKLEEQNLLCIYTGKVLTSIAYNNDNDSNKINAYNMSIDRIDSNNDYTVDNIQLVGARINIMKNDFSHKHFLSLIDLLSISS
jgi:hypothetical protein